MPQVFNYKYLCFVSDQELSFKAHENDLVTQLSVKCLFFFTSRTCFSLKVREKRATFLPVGDGDVDALCLSVSSNFSSPWTLVHSARRFVTGYFTHRCEMYWKSSVSCPSARRCVHWLTPIYKPLLGLSPPY